MGIISKVFLGVGLGLMMLVFQLPAAHGSVDVDGLNQLIKDRKSDVRELEEKIASYKKQISAKQKEISSLKGELSIISNRVAKTELEIESTEIEIEASENELAILKLGIEDKEQSITENKAWIGALLRAIRRADNQDFISVILSDDSLSAFLRSKSQLAEMQGRIDSSMKSLQIAKSDLVTKQQEETQRNEELTTLHDKLEHKRNELKGEVGRKSYLISETQSSEKKYSSMVVELKKKAVQIEAEVTSLERQMREKLRNEGKLKSTGPFSLVWPVPSRYVTSPFHDPGYPFRHIFEHSGTDIRARQGTPLKAASGGYVGRARDNGLGYSYIMLIHPQGFATLYGHVSAMYVKQGQRVEQGEIIGLSGGQPGTPGAGPFVTGAHLHFEVRKNGVPVNPQLFLP